MTEKYFISFCTILICSISGIVGKKSKSAKYNTTESLKSRKCGQFTTKDIPGPFFVEKVPIRYKLAPDYELSDRNQAVVLRGRVFDAKCRGIPKAVVDIWYAGGGTLGFKNLSFP